MTYSGPPKCPDGSVRCNGECVSADKPVSGNCSYYARSDAVFQLDIASNGDLYAALSGAIGEGAILSRIPKGGGVATELTADRYGLGQLEVVGNTLYFITQGEYGSTVHKRTVGRVFSVALPSGKPELIVSDIPDGVIHVVDNHIYVGAQQIEPGLRRYDLDGKNETLLTNANIMDFGIAGDRAYIIDDSWLSQSVKQMPLTGGELTILGGGNCQKVIGADADTLYAHCKGLVEPRPSSLEWIDDCRCTKALPSVQILGVQSFATGFDCGLHDQRVPERQLRLGLKSNSRTEESACILHDSPCQIFLDDLTRLGARKRFLQFARDVDIKLLQYLNTNDPLLIIPELQKEIPRGGVLLFGVPVLSIDEDVGVNEAWHDRGAPLGVKVFRHRVIAHAEAAERRTRAPWYSRAGALPRPLVLAAETRTRRAHAGLREHVPRGASPRPTSA
jgi:hypothetical protein